MKDSDGVFEPTEQQRLAIEATANRMIIAAAAGAGKTAVLVQRYLRHVDDGIKPDQILTITFTKKAAAEMKRRIVKQLRNRGRFEEARIAETGPIQTIHSFCERLLRENALEAGLDPRFEIAAEGDFTELLEGCVREAMGASLEDLPLAEAVVTTLTGRRAWGADSPYAKLETNVQRLIEAFRAGGLDPAELEREYTDPVKLGALFEDRMIGQLPEEVRSLLPSGDVPIAERIRAAYKAAGMKAPRWVAARSTERGDEEALAHTAGLFQIAVAAWSRLELETERAQILDFSALELRALRLLRESPATRKRIKTAYRVLMVDETQDVNPLQHRILDALEIESRMFVGDAQQSIYGFRLADPRIFARLAQGEDVWRLSVNKRSEPGLLGFVDLVFGSLWPNYASMIPPESPIDLDQSGQPIYEGAELWLMPQRSVVETAARIRDLIRSEGVNAREIAVLVRETSSKPHRKEETYGQALQKALRKEGIASRVAGGSERYYARLEVRDLANTLRALADPYDDFSLLATLRSPVVDLSLDSIATLARSKPVIESLPGFEPPVQEDAAKIERFLGWFDPLCQFADRLSAWEVLSELFAVSDYLPRLAERADAHQVLANVRKLLQLAAARPELGPMEYAERIREIQRIKHREGDAPAEDESAQVVTIMTIHKAKGLEWPVVVVPDCHSELKSKSADVEIDPRLGLAISRFGKETSVYHGWLAEQRAEREREEELRLLYVAMTRAEKRLCVVTHHLAKPNTLAKVIAAQIRLGKEPPPGFVVR